MKFWHEEIVRIKADRIIVKLRNKDGTFLESVVIPTTYYPLNGECKVFHYKNTKRVTDQKILDIFDQVKYKYGFCYDNSERLVEELRKNGFDAKPYVGWLFVSDSEYPIHHCWVVINGDEVLDLSDDFTSMLSGKNGERFKGKTREEARELSIDFAIAAQRVKNSVRCFPVGVPTPIMLYIGCECDPAQGRIIYNRLICEYPRHKCERNCDARGLNATQRILKSRGLM